MSAPIPDDWDEAQDGYAILITCIPNSPLWKSLYDGRFYDMTWWNFWDRETGTINDAKAIANQVYEELCMANCQDLIDAINNINVQANVDELTKAVKELTAVLASQNRDLTQPVPNNVDYSEGGISKPLQDAATHIGPHPAP